MLRSKWKYYSLEHKKKIKLCDILNFEVRTLDSLEIRGPMSVSEFSPEPSYWEIKERERDGGREREGRGDRGRK